MVHGSWSEPRKKLTTPVREYGLDDRSHEGNVYTVHRPVYCSYYHISRSSARNNKQIACPSRADRGSLVILLADHRGPFSRSTNAVPSILMLFLNTHVHRD